MLLSELRLLLCWQFLFQVAYSLRSTKSGVCNSICGGAEITSYREISCSDSDYDKTTKGQLMRDCLLCLQNSTSYESPTDNDIYWFLANMKYTLQTCIFTYDNSPALSTCNTSCYPLGPNLNHQWNKPNGEQDSQYLYCSRNMGLFERYQGGCATCLEEQPNLEVLSNFLGAMGSACNTKPNATENQTVSLSQPLFPSTPSTTSASPSASSSAPPSASPSATETSSSGLSSGAKVGVGVGVGVGGAALGVLAGLVFFCIRRRRRAQSSTPHMSQASVSQGYSQRGTLSELSGPTYVSELPAAQRKAEPTELPGNQGVAAELPGSSRS